MSKKKKNKLPMDRYSSYGAVILGILTIVFIAVTWNSTGRYTGEATGTVSEIFYVIPDRAGNWARRCEVVYTADGREYKIRTDCHTFLLTRTLGHVLYLQANNAL